MRQGSREGMTRIEWAGLVTALVVALAMMWPVRGYLTDDTFIHLQYAHNIARGHGFAFNADERVYGSTSPLWVMLLAAGMRLGFDGLDVARVLGFAATLASIVLFMQLMRRNLRIPELRAIATVVWASHAWMMRWSLSGMETPLAVALVLAGFVALTEERTWGMRPARTGFLWALAALTRPEGTFLLLLWGVFLLIETDSREGLRRMLVGVLPPLVIFGGWLVFARLYFGTFWPNTLAAKTAGGGGWPFLRENLLRQGSVIGATDAALVGALLAAMCFGGRRLWPRHIPAQRLVPWVWVGAVPVLYTLRGVPVLSRYLLPLMPILAWLAWRAVERWWVGDEDSPRVRLGAVLLACTLAVLAIGQNVLVFEAKVLPQVRSFTTGLNNSLIPWGRWFDTHTCEQVSIAAPDIGAIGYFSHRRVIDLAGLVTPAMVPLLERQEPEDLVADFSFEKVARPDFLVDRAATEYQLMRRSRYAAALVPIGAASVPNLGIARPGEAVYSFYRIDWRTYDSLATRH